MQDSQPRRPSVIVNTNSYTKGSSTAIDPLCQKRSIVSGQARIKRVKTSHEYESKNPSFSALSTSHKGEIEFNYPSRNLGSSVNEPPKKGNTGSNICFADVFACFVNQFSYEKFEKVSNLP